MCGQFHELEGEMLAFSTLGYLGEGSPNRADAMVWAFSELFPGLVRKAQKEKRAEYATT
jgi:phage terminase large subunit-like protein